MTDFLEVPEEMKSIFHAAYQNNPDNLQKALWALREAGYYQMKTIILLITELKVSLHEANVIVSGSDAWN